MAEIILTAYFENAAGPITGLSPTLRIWEITTTGDELIVGSPCGSGQNTDGAMIEVEDCGSPATTQDGFYRFTFSDTIGYDPTKIYVVRVNSGGSVQPQFRFQVAKITPLDAISVDDIADQVWEEPRLDHLTPGSTGEALSLIKSDTTDIIDKLFLDADSVLEVVQLLLKLEAGRTKIDPVAKTLTIFDEDCTTVLRKYDLFDSSGNKSVTEVCERVPREKGSSDGTTITDVCPPSIP